MWYPSLPPSLSPLSLPPSPLLPYLQWHLPQTNHQWWWHLHSHTLTRNKHVYLKAEPTPMHKQAFSFIYTNTHTYAVPWPPSWQGYGQSKETEEPSSPTHCSPLVEWRSRSLRLGGKWWPDSDAIARSCLETRSGGGASLTTLFQAACECTCKMYHKHLQLTHREVTIDLIKILHLIQSYLHHS